MISDGEIRLVAMSEHQANELAEILDWAEERVGPCSPPLHSLMRGFDHGITVEEARELGIDTMGRSFHADHPYVTARQKLRSAFEEKP
jgi:aryl-alcohol dehydrogenase-like predicted oxidoreductase